MALDSAVHSNCRLALQHRATVPKLSADDVAPNCYKKALAIGIHAPASVKDSPKLYMNRVVYFVLTVFLRGKGKWEINL